MKKKKLIIGLILSFLMMLFIIPVSSATSPVEYTGGIDYESLYINDKTDLTFNSDVLDMYINNNDGLYKELNSELYYYYGGYSKETITVKNNTSTDIKRELYYPLGWKDETNYRYKNFKVEFDGLEQTAKTRYSAHYLNNSTYADGFKGILDEYNSSFPLDGIVKKYTYNINLDTEDKYIWLSIDSRKSKYFFETYFYKIVDTENEYVKNYCIYTEKNTISIYVYGDDNPLDSCTVSKSVSKTKDGSVTLASVENTTFEDLVFAGGRPLGYELDYYNAYFQFARESDNVYILDDYMNTSLYSWAEIDFSIPANSEIVVTFTQDLIPEVYKHYSPYKYGYFVSKKEAESFGLDEYTINVHTDLYVLSSPDDSVKTNDGISFKFDQSCYYKSFSLCTSDNPEYTRPSGPLTIVFTLVLCILLIPLAFIILIVPFIIFTIIFKKRDISTSEWVFWITESLLLILLECSSILLILDGFGPLIAYLLSGVLVILFGLEWMILKKQSIIRLVLSLVIIALYIIGFVLFKPVVVFAVILGIVLFVLNIFTYWKKTNE